MSKSYNAALVNKILSDFTKGYKIQSLNKLEQYLNDNPKDLTKLGGFLFMGLIGIIIASLVNLFFQSGALHFAISVIGVLVFVGLTAYDTQRIKEMYYAGDSESVGG